MIIVLSVLDNMLAPLSGLPPGVKLGLANIITMYALFFMSKRNTVMLIILKSMYILLTRGVNAGLLSFSGGVLSMLIMITLIMVFNNHISLILLSVFGALAHNIGQIAMASLILGSNLIFLYLPTLIVSGIIMGMGIGVLLRMIMPLFKRMQHRGLKV